MSVPYRTVLAEASIRINAIAGAVPATLETNYTASPLTTTEVVSSIFPLSAIIDALLDTEAKLAWAIADCRAHPMRQFISDATAPLTPPTALPSVSNSGIPIIGAWGEVLDEVTGTVLSTQPLDIVRRIMQQQADGLSVLPIYFYNITGGTILATSSSITVTCCVYERDAQETILNSDGDILLPDSLAQAYVCGTVATAMRDDEFVSQASVYAEYFKNALDSIAKGLTLVDGAPQMEVAA